MTPPEPDAAPPPPTGLLHLRTWLPGELDEAFSVWCDDHHAEQLEVPGFRRVRRFSLARATGEGAADYLTVYDLDRLDVLESDGYAAYRARGNTVPDVLQGRLRAARTDAWLVGAVPAHDGLVPDGGGLVHLFVADGPDLADWFADNGLVLVDALTPLGATTARLLRGATGEQIVAVELAPDADVDGPAGAEVDLAGLPLPDGVAVDEGWALYRLDHVNTPDGPAASPHRARHDRP